MKKLIKAAFGAVGLEIRLQRRVREAWEAEKRDAVIHPWRKLQRYQPLTILDIGANDGYSVRLFRRIMPHVTIHSFEPLADCFAKVQAELQQSPPGRAHHFALGDRNETTVIHRSEFSPSSSLLPMDELHRTEFPGSAESHPESVQVRRLDDVAPDLNLAAPVVAKIDVQGFEDRVIRGGENTFRNITAVVIELSSYSLYEGQATFSQVHAQMEQLGFVFRGTIDQMHSPHDGRILQFDGLFENSSLVAEKYPATQKSVQAHTR